MTRRTKPVASTTRSPKPRFAGGLLSDSADRTESGKFNVFGVITVFWAWAFPCPRRWNAIVTLLGLPKGKTSVLASIEGPHLSHRASLQVLDIESSDPDATATVPIPITFSFPSAGQYRMIFSLRDHPGILRLPFEVRLKDWPVLSRSEIKFAQDSPEIPKAMRATVQCEHCGNPYIFEESILSDAPPPSGTRRFPEDGRFECADCGHALYVRDLQGQLRASLKDLVDRAMRRR